MFYAILKAPSWPEYRVVTISEMQAKKFGKTKPYVFTNRKQAHAVLKKVNETPTDIRDI